MKIEEILENINGNIAHGFIILYIVILIHGCMTM